jgi:hypothetical protein
MVKTTPYVKIPWGLAAGFFIQVQDDMKCKELVSSVFQFKSIRVILKT